MSASTVVVVVDHLLVSSVSSAGGGRPAQLGDQLVVAWHGDVVVVSLVGHGRAPMRETSASERAATDGLRGRRTRCVIIPDLDPGGRLVAAQRPRVELHEQTLGRLARPAQLGDDVVTALPCLVGVLVGGWPRRVRRPVDLAGELRRSGSTSASPCSRA